MSEVSRRAVLGAGLSTLSAASALRAHAGTGASFRSWVVIDLVGGADAMSLVVPYRDDRYHVARPHTAIAPPGQGRASAIALDDAWALHPELASLKALFDREELAIAVAVGATTLRRSHLEARSALRRTLVSTLGSGDSPVLDRDDDDASALVGRVERAAGEARRGAACLRVVTSSGWDTHAAQGSGAGGRLATLAGELGRAIEGFRREVGRDLDRVGLVVVSEFGRSLYETPMRGTDDGHAGMCLLVGRGLGVGGVLGTWPGLRPDDLSQRRHVRPTTDLAALLASVVKSEGRRA